MNKKLHFLLSCLLLIFIICLCREKLLEPFGNQIIIHPDTVELNPRETTFSVLTYDTDLDSGYTQASICSDDPEWRNGDKTCLNYSLSGSNCEDIGSDGKSAFDACKVACDNCNTYTEVKRRLRNPSPIEDADKPPYAQFEGGEGGDFGGISGVDIREILGKLDDLKSKMDLCILDSEAGADPATPVVTAEPVVQGVPVDAGGTVVPAFPVVPAAEGGDTVDTPVDVAPSVRTGFCSGNTNTDAEPDIVCTGNNYSDNPNKSTIRSRAPDDCCYKKGLCKGNTDPNSEDEITCTPPGYTDIIGKEVERGTTREECCEKTGFCSGNDDSTNDFNCGQNYKLKTDSDTIVGNDIPTCCDRDLEPEPASEPAPEPSPEPAPEPASEPSPEPAPEPASESGTWKIIKIILIILAVLFSLILVGVIVNNLLEYKKINSVGRSNLTESLLDNEDPGGGIFAGMTILD